MSPREEINRVIQFYCGCNDLKHKINVNLGTHFVFIPIYPFMTIPFLRKKRYLHSDDDGLVPLLGLCVAAVMHYHVHTLAHLRAKLIALDATFLLACLVEQCQEDVCIVGADDGDGRVPSGWFCGGLSV